MAHPLVRAVRAALKMHADQVKAPLMQAYMKSAMPFRGVSSPTHSGATSSRRIRSSPATSSLRSRWSSGAPRSSANDTTDRKLLYDCIEPNLSHTDFFIRKAIGWALRQYAWTDPREVKRYVSANRARLSPLSMREALKNV